MDASQLVEGARRAVQLDRLDDALTLLEALGDLPSPRLWLMRADLHRERCEPELARQALDRALELGAGDAARVRKALMWSPILGDRQALRHEWDTNLAALRALAQQELSIPDAPRALPWLDFYLAYRGRNDREPRELLGQILRRADPDLDFCAPHVPTGGSTDGPVRLGICSAHLKDHTIGRLNQALVRGLGAHGFHVVLAVPELADDPLSTAMAQAADQVLILGRHVPTARERLAQARLDVLHYPDLGMDPLTTWLALARLAPVQTVSWGHPLTSGLPTIDAFLASSFLVPPGMESELTERVVRLPDPMVCWTPPPVLPTRARAELGLPPGRAYLVPQSAFKLHPDFDVVLRRIAQADPDGTIALLAPKRHAWRARLQQRLALPDDRLVWVPRQPREGYLALLRQAEVVLDPFPFAGGHTSLEALAMGTPIVTLPTDQLRGRLTACWYRALGLSDLVASDIDDYVSTAVTWATCPPERARVSQAIAARADRLFERTDAVASHAAAFHQLARSEAPSLDNVVPLRRVG